MVLPFIPMLLMSQLTMSTADLLATVQCEDDPLGYVVPDPTYCDRYLDCDPVRGRTIQLCPPGQGLSLHTGLCMEENKVDCSTREKMYQQRRTRFPPSPVRKILTHGGPGILTNGGSQVMDRRPSAIPVTEATTVQTSSVSSSEDANSRSRLDIFASRRRSNILSSRDTTQAAETSTEVVATTARHFNDATSNFPPRHRPLIRTATTFSPTSRINLPTTFTRSPTRNINKAITVLKSINEEASSLLEEARCEGSEEYVVPDPSYCDRYLSCPDRKVELCSMGMVLDLRTGFCQKKIFTDCKGRELIYRDVHEEEEQVRKIEEETLKIIAATEKALLVSSENQFKKMSNALETTTAFVSTTSSPSNINEAPTTLEAVIKEVYDKEFDSTTSFPSSEEALDPLLDIKCDRGTKEYVVPDPNYCDRYMSCPEAEVELCQRGLVIDLNTGYCQRKTVTDCRGRETLYRDVQDEVKAKLDEKVRRMEEESKGIVSSTENTLTGKLPIFRKIEEETVVSATKNVLQEPIVLSNEVVKGKLISTSTFNPTVRKPITSHSPSLVPSFEVDGRNPISSLSSSRSAIPTTRHEDHFPRIQPSKTGSSDANNPSHSILRDGVISRKPVVSSHSSSMSSPSSSEHKFPRIQISKPSSSDDSNPGRPIVAYNEGIKFQPISTTPISFVSSSSPEDKFPRIQVSKPGSSDNRNPGRPIVPYNEGIKFQPISTTPTIRTSTTTTTPPPTVDSLDRLTCERSNDGYIVPDPEQCDRFAECSPQGGKFYKVCPKGLMLSLSKGVCDYPEQVDCSDRTKLQSSLGKGDCPREQGRFSLPADVSCSQYVDCQGGEGYIQSCGVGQVYDEILGCVHPYQTSRLGCTAFDQNEFRCPTSGLRGKFGDHDRLPHPTDCKLFYSCTKNGMKRLLGCEKSAVFNPETGLCDDQENVPGCEGYYVQEVVTVNKEERDKIAQEIREQLIKEFGLERRFSQ